MHHYPWTAYRYIKDRRGDKHNGECPFCQPEQRSRAVRTTDTMYLMPNRTKYDLFEGIPVIEHLMIIPKKHREAIVEFTKQERAEFADIIAEYESQGYHFLGRGVGTVSRSVQHQHTHLIKLSDKPTQVLLHIKKIHLLLAK
ncbi:MAG: hypothetical protein ACSLEY_00230 [Candidatus Saccharimonadales bacterium]